jgi:hypothetical protein
MTTDQAQGSGLTRQQRVPDILDVIAALSSDAVPTPPLLARALLDLLPAEVWTNPEYRWLDPAADPRQNTADTANNTSTVRHGTISCSGYVEEVVLRAVSILRQKGLVDPCGRRRVTRFEHQSFSGPRRSAWCCH